VSREDRHFKKILVANRGSVATRIMRTCREMGIASVALYSDADKGSGHILHADEIYYLGPSPAEESYLHIEKILQVAKGAGCDAIHPGYGFLSENPAFARRCEEEGITFIGPSSEVLQLLGDKIDCLELMRRMRVPTLPGSEGPVRAEAQARSLVREIGLPVILKASQGGGGLGTRIVRDEAELDAALVSVALQSRKLFGDGTVFIERYLPSARHIEVQILGDRHGHLVHLFDRECSIQRRHQKVIEEAPSPNIPARDRERLHQIALHAAHAVAYRGACTVEFLYDGRDFYFLEINPRLQVEHGVTELITGVDLVRQQIRIAAGAPLELDQASLSTTGYAVEARVYAEDPATLLPAPGTIDVVRVPYGQGVRVDTFLEPGTEISDFYDPMLGKVIAQARSKEVAVRKLTFALRRFVVNGTLRTNIPLLLQVLEDERFLRGEYDTVFLEKRVQYRPPGEEARRIAALAALVVRERAAAREVPPARARASGWRRGGWELLP
jgi:acetyl-CoA carboxylase biotin carboxylase subunit